MGLIKRFSKILRAHLNDFLDKAENPQKLADLAVFEAEEQKIKIHNLAFKTQAALNLSEARLKTLYAERENDPHDQEIIKEIAVLEQERTLHQQSLSLIKKGLKALEYKISSLKSASSVSVNYSEDESAFNTFDRMEHKIEGQEAELEALNDLEKASRLEEELEELKKKLLK
jgi:phage shock protein A